MFFSRIKKNIFFPIIYILLVSALFLYLIYKDFYLYKSQFTEFYTIYYILLLVAFIFSLITFLFSEKANQNIFLTFISIFLSFYIVEIILYFNPINNKKITIENNYNFSDRNYIGPDYFNDNLDSKYYPLSGIANLHTIYCNENGYWANYKSDRYGFNNPDEVWDNLEIDFALLGDSFTHGACVNYPDTFAGNISKKKYKVISLGTSGNGPIREYASYKEYLENKKVKNVVWFYFSGNDLEDIGNESKNNILKNYLNNKNYKQNLIQNISEIDNLKIKLLKNRSEKEKKIEKEKKVEKEKKIKFIEYSFISFLKLSYLRDSFIPQIPYKFFTLPESNNLKIFEKILQRTKNIVNQNNSKLYFVYLPSRNRYIGFDYIFLEKFLIKRLVEKLNIYFIDIHKELFHKIDNPELYYSGHLNENGYKIVTNKVLEIINNSEQ